MKDKYYIVAKDDKGAWDVFRTSNVTVAIAEKLSDDFPVSVCRRTNSDKPIFVVFANSASDAMIRFEKFIKLPNFVYKGK